MCLNIVSFRRTQSVLMDMLRETEFHPALITEESAKAKGFYEDLLTAKNFKICEKDEFSSSYQLDPSIILNKFICHDKDKENFGVFDVYNYYNYETGVFHINIFLKEDYKKNITTVQACNMFNMLIRNQFIMTKCSVARNSRNFEEGLKLCECKFGYHTGKFVFDEWVKQNGIIIEAIEPEILEYMQNREKIEKVSYEFLMNFVQNIDLDHMEPPIDKDPIDFEELANNGELVGIIKELPV